MTVNTPCKYINNWYPNKPSLVSIQYTFLHGQLLTQIWSSELGQTEAKHAHVSIYKQKKKFPSLPTITYLETKNWMFLDLAWKMDPGPKAFNELFKKSMPLNLIRNSCPKCQLFATSTFDHS